MPQQLKQFVENSKKQKEFKNFDSVQGLSTDGQNYGDKNAEDIMNYEPDIDFGKHFLSFSNSISSEDEIMKDKGENGNGDNGNNSDGNTVIDMSVHE